MSDWLDTAISWFQNTLDNVKDQGQEWSQDWQNQVDTFKQKAREFIALFTELKGKEDALKNADDETKKRYEKLMSRGDWIFKTIQSIASKIDWAINSFSGIGMGGMGILPVVPIAVIAGALAVITAWLSDAYSLNKKLDTIKELEAKGHSADDIRDLVHGAPLINIGGNLSGLLMPAVIGITVIYFWPELRKRFGL